MKAIFLQQSSFLAKGTIFHSTQYLLSFYVCHVTTIMIKFLTVPILAHVQTPPEVLAGKNVVVGEILKK